MWPRYGAPGNSDVDSLEGVNKNITYMKILFKGRKTNTPTYVDFRQKFILRKFITSKI